MKIKNINLLNCRLYLSNSMDLIEFRNKNLGYNKNVNLLKKL